MTTYFKALDAEEHAKGNAGYDVPDYCRNCNTGYMSHINGRCPNAEPPPRAPNVSREKFAPGSKKALAT